MNTVLPKLPKPSIQDFNQARAAGGYEVYADWLIDTVTYPAAGVASLDVFTTQSADETITNLKQPGQIPKPEKFHGFYLYLAPLIDFTVDADLTAASLVRDLQRVFVLNRGILKLWSSRNPKPRAGIPLDAIGVAGGVDTTAYGNNAPAAAGSATKVLPRLVGAPYPFEIALDSNEQIQGSIKWGNAQAISANLQFQVRVFGWRYRPAS